MFEKGMLAQLQNVQQKLIRMKISIFCFLIAFAPLYAFSGANTPSDSLKIKQVIALNDSGVFCWKKKDFQKALNLLSKALTLSEQSDLKTQKASALNNIGLVYYSQGEYARCLDYYNRSISVLRETGDSLKIAQSLLNTGIVYKKQGIYDKATTLLLEAAKYFQKSNRYSELSSCYNAIANSQSDLKYYSEALKYHFNALKIRMKIGDSVLISSSLNNIGITYKELDSLSLAQNYFNQSLAIKTKLGDKMQISTTETNIADILFFKHDYINAEKKYLNSYQLRKEINDQNGLVSVSNKLGELYLRMGLFDKSKTFFDEGLAIARKIKSNELELNNLKLQAQLYESRYQFGKALKMYESYDTLRNQMFDSEKAKAISELRIKYEVEKSEAEIKSLNQISASQADSLKAKTKAQYALAFGLFMFLILAVVAFIAYRQKQRTNVQIKTLMQERQHRAKNNLQIITQLLGLQSAYLEHEQAKGAIRSGENRMQAVSLIDKMLYQNPENTEIEMSDYVPKLAGNLSLMFEPENNKTKVQIEAEPFGLDASKATPLGLILNELITNSYKYAFQGHLSPEIFVGLQKKQEIITLKYRDNGPGLKAGFQISQAKSLGLKLIQSLSKQLKGTFVVENRDGFYFELTFKP
jgi:two-component sensor histidine kinase